jgi:hypothetical protein
MALKFQQTGIRYYVNWLLKVTSLFALLSSVIVHADILSCTDVKGKTIYTDNRALCNGVQEKSVKVVASAQTNKQNKGKVNYRIPSRQYDSVGSSYQVFIERDLVEGNAKLASQATQKLEATLKEIFFVLPESPAKKLSQLRFYVMWGEDSPKGGRESGMSYFRLGEPKNYPYLDTRWENVVVIYSAKNLMYLDALWSKKALMHELAHAWHLNNWPENYEPILRAYRNANDLGLYRNVTDNKGKIIKEAYAIKNHLEYFAELSAIYFVGGNYFPNNRAGLFLYDEYGFELVRQQWGIK